ncbi:MAG: hypothetical protein IJG62_07430, partial [Synergistaceae bacterium]|nr:hypothetical protein [Synergistaceae bacterium]
MAMCNCNNNLKLDEMKIEKLVGKRVEKKLEVNIPTEFGVFRVHAYRSSMQDDDAHTHLALVM